MTPLDHRLLDWSSIENRFRDTLLVGNGASLAVWEQFRYASLYRRAALTIRDRRLFDDLGTTNFEGVLEALRIGRLVCGNAGHPTRALFDQYRRVRRALVRAVGATHIPWTVVPDESLRQINQALRQYDYVFSTNYDLLIYWAMMSRQARGFRDYFWGPDNSFDPTDVATSGSLTRVLYLHGGIHLYRAEDGSACKRVADDANLLEVFATSRDVPLFISEGTYGDKLAAIRRSDYLSFAYESLAQECDRLVIFGHGLTAQDRHLRDVIRRRSRRLAISIVPATRHQIVQRKLRLTGHFPDATIEFFDARSHPLGNASLLVQP